MARSIGLAVRFRHRQDGEPFRTVLLEPVGEPIRFAAVAGNEASEFLLGGGERGRVPDPPQLAPDALADGGSGRVVKGILRDATSRPGNRRGGRPSTRHDHR